MADNRESTRIGFLVDGDPLTDLMTAIYEFDELNVRVKVPYLADDDARGRWWTQGVMFVDDPDRTKHSYSPPSELDYFDNVGSVGLIDCRSGGGKHRLGGVSPAAGVGNIHAAYAVEGAYEAANFVKPNGLRSEMDGLAHWLGFSALRTVFTFKDDGSSPRASTSTELVDDMLLARAMNLKAIGYATGSGLDTPEVTYRSMVFLETFVKSGRTWDEHLALHTALRSLLRVSAWKPISFQSHKATSLKETVTIKNEEKRLWREVRTATTGIAPVSWTSADRFLFLFSDIGRAGFGKWLKLVDDYSRGIQPLVRLLDLEGATIDAHISQLGIAVEAVGYQSLIDSGLTPGAANRMNVKERIDHLLTEVAGSITFDTTTFAQDFADSYNSVKHANRPVVAPATIVDQYRNGVRMLRAWVALKVGMKASVVASRW